MASNLDLKVSLLDCFTQYVPYGDDGPFIFTYLFWVNAVDFCEIHIALGISHNRFAEIIFPIYTFYSFYENKR